MGPDRTPVADTGLRDEGGGRPEKHPRREIVDAIRYVVDTGCKWRALPKDFPPWRTCYGFMARWAARGVIGQIRDQLRKRVRREMGRAPGAVATVIDSQSIKAAETVGRDSRGYYAGKKINGRKRHLVVDTKGLPLFVMVTPADMTDRNAAKEVLFRLRLMHPEITIVWADSAYAGQLVTWAKTYLNLTIKTVSRPKDASGFVVLPRRWVVERSHAWVMHARRHARDYERLIQHSESLITWAAITLMTRRITRRSSRRNGQPASRKPAGTDRFQGQDHHLGLAKARTPTVPPSATGCQRHHPAGGVPSPRKATIRRPWSSIRGTPARRMVRSCPPGKRTRASWPHFSAAASGSGAPRRRPPHCGLSAGVSSPSSASTRICSDPTSSTADKVKGDTTPACPATGPSASSHPGRR